MKTMHIRTRMAPSPTGDIHVGSMSILLKNYAFAKRHNGSFILRIEDTDKEREVPGAIDRIQECIKAYGLDWDEGPGKEGAFGPYIQSQRLQIYKKYAQELVDAGKAYYCTCSSDRLTAMREAQRDAKIPPKYDRYCLSKQTEIAAAIQAGSPYVIRLKTPEHESVVVTDLIRGKIEFDSDTIDDQVLLKSDGYPTYHMAVVVDDHLMEITHIMRGEEWISSTPKHVLLYQAFGWKLPVFAHIPVYLNPDGKGKMSKRKGTVSAQSFLDRGYLPAALLNFFMILGWSHPEEKEVLTLEEFIQHFDPKDVSAKSVVFDLQKLNWLNGVYIRQLTIDELVTKLEPFIPATFPKESLKNIIPLVHERLETLADFANLTSFFYEPVQQDIPNLLKKADTALVSVQLTNTLSALQSVQKWEHTEIEKILRELQEKYEWKKSQYFMMLRVASTGRTATPPLFETMQYIGKAAILSRLEAAQTAVST